MSINIDTNVINEINEAEARFLKEEGGAGSPLSLTDEVQEGEGAGAAGNSPPPSISSPNLSATIPSADVPHQANPGGDGATPAPAPTVVPTPVVAPPSPPLLPHLSSLCDGLQEKHAQLKGLFLGSGKKAGKLLGLPAVYDKAYVNKLVLLGVTDEKELAEALMSRPDNHAANRGEQYAKSVVQAVKAAHKAADDHAAVKVENAFEVARNYTNFTVDAVVIIESDESRYEFTIKTKKITLTAKQLAAGPKDFVAKYVNALQQIPTLPPMKGQKCPLWDPLVNGWLQSATKKQLPGNATDEEVRLRAVEKAKNGLIDGERIEGLLDESAFKDTAAGLRYFTADAIFAKVRPLDSKLTLRDVALCLMELRCSYSQGFLVGTSKLDVWTEPLPPPTAPVDQVPTTEVAP